MGDQWVYSIMLFNYTLLGRGGGGRGGRARGERGSRGVTVSEKQVSRGGCEAVVVSRGQLSIRSLYNLWSKTKIDWTTYLHVHAFTKPVTVVLDSDTHGTIFGKRARNVKSLSILCVQYLSTVSVTFHVPTLQLGPTQAESYGPYYTRVSRHRCLWPVMDQRVR